MYITFVFYIPDEGGCVFWTIHVGIHCVYKLISLYLCAFLGAVIVYILE